MSKFPFFSLVYGTVTPLFLNKCGGGSLEVSDGELAFLCKKGWFETDFTMPREEVFVRVLSGKRVRVFNRKYRYFYFSSDHVGEILDEMKKFHFTTDLGDVKIEDSAETAQIRLNVLAGKMLWLDCRPGVMTADDGGISVKTEKDDFYFDRTGTLIEVADAERFLIKCGGREISVLAMPDIEIVTFLAACGYRVAGKDDMFLLPKEKSGEIFIFAVLLMLFLQMVFLVVCNVIRRS